MAQAAPQGAGPDPKRAGPAGRMRRDRAAHLIFGVTCPADTDSAMKRRLVLAGASLIWPIAPQERHSLARQGPIGQTGQIGSVVAVNGHPSEATVPGKLRGDDLQLAVHRRLPLLE